MCTYNVNIDDKLAYKMQSCFNNDYEMNQWIQEQMTLLFLGYTSLHQEKQKRHKCKYTDVELEGLLSDCPMVAEDRITEISDEDYKTIVRNMPHKPFKNVEKWL